MSYENYVKLMPNGEQFQPLFDLVRSYVGHEFEFGIQVVLAGSEIPDSQLGAAEHPTCLGWNSWLGGQQDNADRGDACFESSLVEAGVSKTNRNNSP